MTDSSVFDAAYARYYDLLYRDKDYAGEAAYIERLIRQHHPTAQKLLDLGCGTGRHALLLAQAGYQVTGVDRSQRMLQMADRRRAQETIAPPGAIVFAQSDIGSLRLHQSFDVITALFHVISYQTTSAELNAFFETVRNHLTPDGLFLFDFWYGPAVLTQRPSVRVKHLADPPLQITRIAEPLLHPNRNVVDVHYQIFVQDDDKRSNEQLEEAHSMRYLFKPELDCLLQAWGMKCVVFREWMTDREPGTDTWSVYLAAQLTEK